MKKFRIYSIVLFLFVITSNFAVAQENEALAKFNVSENDNSLLITWTIKAGFSCSDLHIEHSSDGINYSTVYSYPGICGAIGNDETFNFNHEDPKTGNNFYKIDLGFFGFSEPLSANFINKKEKGYVIYPMPVQKNSKISFYNPGFLKFTLIVSEGSGKVVYLEDNITKSEVQINNLNLQKGTYHFILSNGNISYSGTFIKL